VEVDRGTTRTLDADDCFWKRGFKSIKVALRPWRDFICNTCSSTLTCSFSITTLGGMLFLQELLFHECGFNYIDLFGHRHISQDKAASNPSKRAGWGFNYIAASDGNTLDLDVQPAPHKGGCLKFSLMVAWCGLEAGDSCREH